MAFDVRLVPSGRTFPVPDGRRVLEAGFDSGVKMPNGCRLGNCRSCMGKVIEGTFDQGLFNLSLLTEDLRSQGYALLCQATPSSDMVIEIEELPFLTEPQLLPAYVKSVGLITKDVAVVNLRLPLHSNMPFTAGQYIDILLPGGHKRSYSIANPPRPEGVIDVELHIRHVPGGLYSGHVFSGMKDREKVSFEGPYGSFFLRESAKPVVFLATGTGYAPIRSILLDALKWGTEREIVLYWGDRSREDLYMFDEASALAEAHANVRFVPVLSRPAAGDNWTGRTGHVQDVALEDIDNIADCQVYACGSPRMIAEAESRFVALGLPLTEFFSDAFFSEVELRHTEIAEIVGT